jgi:hypothetical protein
MQHTARKLSIHVNIDKRIREAKRQQKWVYEQPNMTASAKFVYASQSNAIEMALTRLRDESQVEEVV